MNDLIPGGTGWELIDATGINNRGQIVGTALVPGGQTRAYLLTSAGPPIPLPPGAWLALPILIGIVAHGQLKRVKGAAGA